MGLLSSLHCAGMCGPVAAGLMFSFDIGTPLGRLRALFAGHGGRVAAYVLAGMALGALGSSVLDHFDRADAYLVVRWSGAILLAWIGLSEAALMPTLAPMVWFARVVTPAIERVAGLARSAGMGGAALSGFFWGCAPCGMVYSALFYAMMSGSMTNGAAVMLGFGLGTLPSLTALALGLSRLRSLSRLPGTRMAVGLSIVTFAILSVNIPETAWHVLCLQ